jgi:hypothetical protein
MRMKEKRVRIYPDPCEVEVESSTLNPDCLAGARGLGYHLFNIRVRINPDPVLTLCLLLAATNAFAQESLPELVVSGQRVAIDESVSTIATVATPLRYEPYVDLQERGTPEGQGDVVIRGSTFENTAVSLGGLSLFDPQTGHYVLELPLSPNFFSAPEILTGSEQSLKGMNSSVGSVGYNFQQIKTSSAQLRAGAGEYGTHLQSVFLRQADLLGEDAPTNLGVDLEYSRSRSSGTRRFGDSEFDRISGRLQLNSELGQTDLFGGFQHKYLSWPNLYALQELHNVIGSSGIESDELRTGMVGLHHEVVLDGEGSNLKGGFLYRENRDDYELDRFSPGLFNPFQHNVRLASAGVEGTFVRDNFRIRSSAKVLSDWITSTALTFGNFDSRTLFQAAIVPELELDLAENRDLTLFAGARFDDSDRDTSKVLPVAGVSYRQKRSDSSWERAYLDFSGASQVAGYTALASNPSGGLFRGNADLARTSSFNSELGLEVSRSGFSAKTAAFVRRDNNLVDWVYNSQIQPFAPRSATNLDITTAGIETLARVELERSDLIFSYAYLSKNQGRSGLDFDASFYALNFPNHRLTASAVLRLTEQVTLRTDNEFRIQERNTLRATTDRSFIISTATVQFDLPWVRGLSVDVVVDNIGNENFEEIPGVPGRRRFSGGFVSYRY